MAVVNSWSVVQTGIGAPDYSNTVSSSIERSGFRVKYGESVSFLGTTFSDTVTPWPWYVLPLAVGGTQGLIDFTTGAAFSVIPIGYYLEIISFVAKPSQDVSAWCFFDGVETGAFLQLGSGQTHYENEVSALNTLWADPTGATAHTFSVRVVNEGGGTLYGGFSLFSLLTEIGTPPLPTTKNCICKWCGHVQTVPVITTRLTCPKCKEETWYYTFVEYERRKRS